ncbi:MAG: zinc-ribbon domain-containing protein [Christensenellales bacterium]
MAFCTNCGAQVSDGTKFCPDCGQKIGGSEPATHAAPVQAVPVQAAPVQPVQKEEPKQAEAPVQGTYQATYTPPTQQSYTPPAQQSAPQQTYTPPTQQSYTPPTQQSAPQQTYTPPTQQSYQPQGGQQSYSAMNGGAYAQPAYATAPRQKKPMNKKTLFIIGGAVLAVILVVALIGAIGGKGGETVASSDPNAGVYTAVSAEMMGMDVDVDTVWTEGFTIELMDKGKCAMEIDGTKANGKWTLDGTAFHIKGGGLDCDGTLANGKLELENVLDMGITLKFTRAGGAAGASAGGVSDASASELQKQWNGTWYGCLYVSEATGAFADIPSDFYDVYMVVDVDASGKGQFAVFLDGVDEAFALATCEAKESGLYAIDGTIAGGEEMYAYNWMFLPMPDYPDQYVMGDVIENGDNIFDFKLFMKQWGGSWQDEIDSDFAITPPSVAWYESAIANGELPPVGFAPINYAGTAASVIGNNPDGLGSDGLEPGEVPDDQMEPQPTTGGEYGSSVAGADGIVPLDVLITAGKYCNEHRNEVTYEQVYKMMGNVHGAAQVDRDSWKPGEVHQYGWSAESGEYIFINFHVADDGSEYWNSMSSTMGLLK